MAEQTPRCPHCRNLTVVASIPGRLIAVCLYCDNGFAVAGNTMSALNTFPAQQVTREQLEHATSGALDQLTKLARQKQDELQAQDAALPEDRESWTEEQQVKAAQNQSERMMYAGVLQGASSFRAAQAKILGLSPVTLAAEAPN